MSRARRARPAALFHMLGAIACALGLVVAHSTSALAQAAEPELAVTARLDPPAGTIGMRVTLTVEVVHSDEVLVTVQRPTIAGSEVVADSQPTSTVEPDGSIRSTFAFEYQVFRLGEVETGPLRVSWLLEDGTTGFRGTPGVAMTIVSVRAPGDEALRPLKPQEVVEGAPPAWVRPAAAGGGVLAVALLAAGAVAWWRRRPRGAAEAVPVAVAEASARERLDALRHLRLGDDSTFQAFYGEIALVVRRYLGERFGFNAAALTTSELERRMTAHGVDRWQARLVGGLLDRCDRAVYARQYPDPASADHDLTVAYEIVELSRPRPVAVEPAAS